ncbi:hypothetical protein GILI108418_09040 [Gillisia limnaea]
MIGDNQIEYNLQIVKEKAMLNGISPQQILGNLTYCYRNIQFQIYMMKILAMVLRSHLLLMIRKNPDVMYRIESKYKQTKNPIST